MKNNINQLLAIDSSAYNHYGSADYAPGRIVRPTTDYRKRIYLNNGWIDKRGDIYVLTRAGYRAVTRPEGVEESN